MAKSSAYDLIVIGGGPAGTTLATLAKKYNPERRILIVEKTPFPRHHVGESLLPGLVPVLKEMGVFEKIDGAGFPKKLGATYIWGKDRAPWEADFGEINIGEMFAKYGRILDTVEYAWHVRRSEYDKILLDHARACGVEVWEGWGAKSIVEDAQRVVGVRLTGPQGQERSLRCEFLADCSGQAGFMSRFRSVRQYNEKLRNIAGYAYYRGAPWKYEYSGHPDKTRLFVTSVKDGWFWYFPVDRDLVTVGLVTSVAHFRASGAADFRTLFDRAVQDCPEIRSLLQTAQRVADVEKTGEDFFTLSDWSYIGGSAAGDGWIAAGDAAVFVDPVLSSGVTLAHLSGQRAAYTLGTYWREKDPSIRRELIEDYNAFYREAASLFLALALYWYGNDPCAELWWGEAKRALEKRLPFSLSDKHAFILVASGLTFYFERQFAVQDVAERQGATAGGDLPFYKTILEHVGPGPAQNKAEPLRHESIPRFLYPVTVGPAFLPDPDAGHLKCAWRATFLRAEGDSQWAQVAVNPRRYVTAWQRFLIESVDGRTSLMRLEELLAARWALDAERAHAAAHAFLGELARDGLLAFGPRVGEEAAA